MDKEQKEDDLEVLFSHLRRNLSKSQNDDLAKINRLLNMLESCWQSYEIKNQSEPGPNYADAKKVIYEVRARAFGTRNDPSHLKEQSTFSVSSESDVIQLNLDPGDIGKLIQGLILLNMQIYAKAYIASEEGINWGTVAEIMMIKQPGERLRRRPKGKNRRYGQDHDEVILYKVLIESGRYSANKAAELVFKKFEISSEQDTFNQWLRDEIKRLGAEFPELYGGLPKPEKSPKAKH